VILISIKSPNQPDLISWYNPLRTVNITSRHQVIRSRNLSKWPRESRRTLLKRNFDHGHRHHHVDAACQRAAHDKLRERTSWLIRYGLVIEGSQSRKTELAKDITS
jgi:hypothetical protein